MGEGLQGICRGLGEITINGVKFYWDYVADKAVTAKEMPKGSKRWKESQKWRDVRMLGGKVPDPQ